MNKKRFAILMVIALILSSFTFAYANNSGGNSDNKEKTSNRKIHVHLEANRDDIAEVFVVIGGVKTPLEARGNSGNYTAPKTVTPSTDGTLSQIIVKTKDGTETTYSAEESQQGQEGQGSINYRIKTTESNNEEDATDDLDDIDDNVEGGGEIIADGGNSGSEGNDNTGETEGDDNDAADGENNTTEDSDRNNTPSDSTTENNESFITIELTIQEIPQGTPELQEITPAEETPAEPELDTLDLEDEETPLAIPSTGVATPLFYGAGALISLLGLLKRR